MTKRTRGTAKPAAKKEAIIDDGTIDRHGFINTLDLMKPAISKSDIEESSQLILIADGRLVSHNEDMTISLAFNPETEKSLSGITGGIYANELLSLLKKIDDERIIIAKSSEDNQMLITAGGTEAGFNILPGIEAPPLGITAKTKWEQLPDGFCNAVNLCVVTVATNESMGVLVYIMCDGERLYSCDNYQGSFAPLSEKMQSKFMIHYKTARVLANYEPVEVAMDAAWVHFRNEESIVLSSRIIGDEYPDIFGLFEVEGKEITFPPEIMEALELVETLADEKTLGQKNITVRVDKTEIVCETVSDMGFARKRIACKNKQVIPEFIVSAKMFAGALARKTKAKVSERSILFEDDDVTYVVMLVNKTE